MTRKRPVIFKVIALVALLIVNYMPANPQSNTQNKRSGNNSHKKNKKRASVSPMASKSPADQGQASSEFKCETGLESCKLGNNEACIQYLKRCFNPWAQPKAENRASQETDRNSDHDSPQETAPETPEIPRGFFCDFYRKDCLRGDSDACKLYLIECC